MKEVEEHKKVARFDNKIIEKNLFKFEQKLTINQQKVLYYLIIQEKNGNSLQNITWNKLQELLGIASGEKYSAKQKKNFLKEVKKVELGLEKDENNMEFHTIFPSIGLRYNKLYYTINSEIKDLFNQPNLDYYLMNYELIQHFRHDHSIRIYEMLNKRVGANDKSVHDFPYSIEELRVYLNLHINEYKDVKDLRKWVLEPSLQEISELTDINIDGKYNAKTKKVQLSSKKWGEDVIYIRGISRKNTVQEYVQEQFDNAIIAKEDGKTKIDKTSKEEKLKENKQTDLPINTVEQIEIKSCGEFGHVKLSFEQFQKAHKLFANLEELERAITLLDEYLEQNPDKHYANHYISLKQFSKKIIEAEKESEGNYKSNTYKKQELLYEEPVYAVADTIEVANMTEEEAKALLENPFGEEKVVEKNVDTSANEVVEINNLESEDTLEDEIVSDNDSNNMPTGLYSDVVNLYFWFFEGVVAKEQAPNALKKLEKKYDYILSKEEKIKLYRKAKDEHAGKYPW